MHRSIQAQRGFTLIEILIVVIILGILAAIVIPQFGSASTSAKTSATMSTVQSLRQQIELYKLQHNDMLPRVGAGGFRFWQRMIGTTDSSGNDYFPGVSVDGPFGPYMQSIPTNALNGSNVVLDAAVTYPGAAASVCGFVFDYTGGSGHLYATGSDGKTVIGP